jgi:hypothetical protein
MCFSFAAGRGFGRQLLLHRLGHERLRDIASAGNKLRPSGSVLVSVESVIHACKFPLSTAKYTLSASAFFYFKACTAGLVFFQKKNTSTCYLLVFYADPSLLIEALGSAQLH